MEQVKIKMKVGCTLLSNNKNLNINDIEEFSEILSNLIVEKIENKVELKYIERDDALFSISEDSFRDWDLDNLFDWTYEEKGWKLKVIDENLMIFLQGFLSKSKNKLYKKLIKSLQSDAIVGLMHDSLEKLMTTQKKETEVLKSIYCDHQYFHEKINYFGQQYDVEQIDETISKLDQYLKDCQHVIPSQLIPFATYALMNNPKITTKTVNDLLNHTKNLRLKWINETAPDPQNENINHKIILNAHLSFELYVSFLDKVVIPFSGDQSYNSSLNFYVFNQSTSLYDVYVLSKEIFENSNFINIQKKYPKKFYGVLDRTQKYTKKNQLVEGLAHLSQIDGIMLKRFMLKHHLSSQIFKSIDLVDLSNWLITICKDKLREAIVLKDADSDLNYFNVYSDLSGNYSPYDKLIRKISNNQLLYKESFESTSDYIKYELYHYAYKAMYREKANV
ncbi:hypothetical protein [uncultured Exiguobacterium sp.]|uniref:hypothetical protein n=1 Tax=uncultured Exiguobacterium sp. TaxID=202669 RepID=UPI003748602C